MPPPELRRYAARFSRMPNHDWRVKHRIYEESQHNYSDLVETTRHKRAEPVYRSLLLTTAASKMVRQRAQQIVVESAPATDDTLRLLEFASDGNGASEVPPLPYVCSLIAR